ncbi:MAG: NADP-dependent isocitrate dehydrogenase, partial [Gammaproteobacteria bacterium]|nr:NADP-dependent isocitrate dehydrogenase [Gammaproteobacteria bacterium]
MTDAKIIYTHTDEAPALATYSLLPIIEAYTAAAGVNVETRDISLASRILAGFADQLPPEQQHNDALAELGELAKTPAANIIKLPNISASIPQLKEAVRELQAQGFALPDFPDEPKTEAEQAVRQRYAKALGSAVNPVLREGNSDRRVAAAVKEYARAHPHRLGAWSKDSLTRVAHMEADDFYGSEQSKVMAAADELRIEFVPASGAAQVLKASVPVQGGEVIDASCMSRTALREFFTATIAAARDSGVLLSLHLKATMMKISDPIMFGHAVEVYFAPVFEKHAATFAQLGVNARNGFGDVVSKIAGLPAAQREAIEADIDAVYAAGPLLAMVDSRKGITNLHVPNNIIIDASM